MAKKKTRKIKPAPAKRKVKRSSGKRKPTVGSEILKQFKGRKTRKRKTETFKRASIRVRKGDKIVTLSDPTEKRYYDIDTSNAKAIDRILKRNKNALAALVVTGVGKNESGKKEITERQTKFLRNGTKLRSDFGRLMGTYAKGQLGAIRNVQLVLWSKKKPKGKAPTHHIGMDYLDTSKQTRKRH